MQPFQAKKINFLGKITESFHEASLRIANRIGRSGRYTQKSGSSTIFDKDGLIMGKIQQ